MARNFQVEVKEDSPVGATSVIQGDSLDSVIFNLSYIAVRDPNLLVDILGNLKRAKRLLDSPVINYKSPEMLIALERFQRLFNINLI